MKSTDERVAGRAIQCMEIRGGTQAVEERLTMPGLDAWVYCRPHEGAVSGGDLHYLSVCGGGTTTRLLVADVSGHGVSAAGFSATLRELMRKNINTKSQTRLVETLNRKFLESAEGLRFATAIVATYLSNQKRLTVCNAGHPRPLWRHAATGHWDLLDQRVGDRGNLPLGIDDQSAYHQFSVELAAGDVVLFYTDALPEAVDPAGKMLGEEGLLGLARGLELEDARQTGRALLAEIDGYRGGRPADDDTTLLAFVHNAQGARHLSISEKLDVYAKFFGLKAY